MNLSKLQKEIVKHPSNKIVVMAAAASGKALENGSKVYTENGPKLIEQLSIGEKIYGQDGKLYDVVGVFPQGKKKKFIVEFSDGNFINCCEEHLWTFQTESLRSKKSKTWYTKTLKEIIENYPLFKDARAKNNFSDKSTSRKNIFIPMCEPINFPKQNLPLLPYTLGALLGDGQINGNGKESIFSNEDKDVLERVNKELAEIGYCLKHKNNYDYSIRQNNKPIGQFKKGKLTLILEELGLDYSRSNNKFIPNIYKYGAIEDRIELLRGIIDTDGYCEGSSYDITLKSKQLILDIKEICESLGLTAVYQEKKAICTNSSIGIKDCGTVYRLRIKTSKIIQKLHYSQKREKQWKPSRVYSHRAIVNIIPTNEEVEMTCIKINSPNHLFVTNNFIVTHNTTVLTERVRYLLNKGVNPETMAVITFTNLAAEEMRTRLGADFKDGMYMGTIHGLANRFVRAWGIDTSDAIENEKFDRLFELVKENPGCVKHFDWIILDEAQDSDTNQFNFIFNMIDPDNFFVVGDLRQHIYQFNGGSSYFLECLAEENGVTCLSLNENYRNGEDILNYARKLISKTGLYDDSIAINKGGKVFEYRFTAEQLAQGFKKMNNYKDWVVLCRYNNAVDSTLAVLKKNGIPCDGFKQGGLTRAQLHEKMQANTVKVLTIHSAKGLEWDNVAVLEPYIKVKPDDYFLMYVAATRAKKKLYWNQETAPWDKPDYYRKKQRQQIEEWE